MQDNSYLPNCGDHDVCSFNENMVKIGNLRSALISIFENEMDCNIIACQLEKRAGIKELRQHSSDRRKSWHARGWFSQGVDCEILKMGAKGWQKGKMRIRVSVEFCPDEPAVEDPPASNKPESTEPESPLDDIRRMIKEENQ